MPQRPAAVAGQFYPGDAAGLRATVQGLLQQAPAPAPAPAAAPVKALIVPHAGYVYSGPIAATAYARLAAQRGTIRRVVLLGPAHRAWTEGLAAPAAEAFGTPLGPVPVDRAAIDSLRRLPQVHIDDRPHALEHSLEVQLPFLKETLGDFALVPLVVGEARAADVAAALELLWGGPETIIVVSSDLSHYHSYAVARERDAETCEAILELQTLKNHDQACGATPVNGLTLAARKRGLTPELLDLRNSGDTAGDHQRVVGYAAFAYTETPDDR